MDNRFHFRLKILSTISTNSLNYTFTFVLQGGARVLVMLRKYRDRYIFPIFSIKATGNSREFLKFCREFRGIYRSIVFF